MDQPTYRKIGDHSESIQIDFDPERITYRRLLDFFWQDHDPTSRSWRRQYMSAAFYHDDDQKRAIEATKVDQEERLKAKIVTEIGPVKTFYRAEDYHQKYYLQQNRQLADEYKALYPDPKRFTDSTAIARVNGYLGGYGSLEKLNALLPQLGLSPNGQMRLKEQLKYRAN